MARSLADTNLPVWVPNGLTVVVLLMAAFNYFGPFADLDWSWQVRTGGQIVETGTLRIEDRFSYTIAGQQLHDFEWLYEVTLWLVWNTFGMGGLKFLRVLLVGATMWIVARRLQRENVPWHAILLVLFLCFFVLAPVWNLRPLYCTTIGLLLVSGWLHEHCTGRRPLPWMLPFAMLIWANSHPGVIAGQGLLVGAMIWETMNRWLRWNTPLEGPALLRLLVVAGLGLAMSFVCPDPIDRIRYTFHPNLAHPIHRIIIEMQPTYLFLFMPPFNFLPIYLVAAFVLLSVVMRFRHYRMWELAYLAALGLLANVASRSAMDWFLNLLALGVPHLCVMWKQALSRPRRTWVRPLLKIDHRLKRLFTSSLFRPQTAWLVGGLLVFLVASLIPPLSRNMPRQTSDEWPVAAAEFMEANGLGGNIFAAPDLAAYMTWHLKDAARSYTDTRTFFFPPVLVEDSHYLLRLEGDWKSRIRRVLDDYRTDYFLLETEHSRGQLWKLLEPYVPTPLFRDERTVLLSADQVRAALRQLPV